MKQPRCSSFFRVLKASKITWVRGCNSGLYLFILNLILSKTNSMPSYLVPDCRKALAAFREFPEDLAELEAPISYRFRSVRSTWTICPSWTTMLSDPNSISSSNPAIRSSHTSSTFKGFAIFTASLSPAIQPVNNE